MRDSSSLTVLRWLKRYAGPIRATARVYRADGSEAILAMSDVLHGEDVLPGFECALESMRPHVPRE